MCAGRRNSLYVSAEPKPVAQRSAVLRWLAAHSSLASTDLQS
jgi:hypothetical protein